MVLPMVQQQQPGTFPLLNGTKMITMIVSVFRLLRRLDEEWARLEECVHSYVFFLYKEVLSCTVEMFDVENV